MGVCLKIRGIFVGRRYMVGFCNSHLYPENICRFFLVCEGGYFEMACELVGSKVCYAHADSAFHVGL